MRGSLWKGAEALMRLRECTTEDTRLARRRKKLHSLLVAKPIEPTPPLEGEEAERLLQQLQSHCSEEEAARRLQKANEFWQEFVRGPDWEPQSGNA